MTKIMYDLIENRLKIVTGMKWGLLLLAIIYFTIYGVYSFGNHHGKIQLKNEVRTELLNCQVANVCRVKSLDMIIYPMAKSKMNLINNNE